MLQHWYAVDKEFLILYLFILFKSVQCLSIGETPENYEPDVLRKNTCILCADTVFNQTIDTKRLAWLQLLGVLRVAIFYPDLPTHNHVICVRWIPFLVNIVSLFPALQL